MPKIPWHQNGPDTMEALDDLWRQKDDHLPNQRRVEVDVRYREQLRERRRRLFEGQPPGRPRR